MLAVEFAQLHVKRKHITSYCAQPNDGDGGDAGGNGVKLFEMEEEDTASAVDLSLRGEAQSSGK